MNPEFRKKWMPKASDPYFALNVLSNIQKNTNKSYRCHWAYIKDQNDSDKDTHILGKILSESGKPNINIVRYNPFSKEQGTESDWDELSRNVWILKKQYGLSVKVISRVGFDINASCGMFL